MRHKASSATFDKAIRELALDLGVEVESIAPS